MHPFSEAHLSEVLRAHVERITRDIKGLESDYVLKASPTELEEHFIDQVRVSPLVLRADDKVIGERRGVDVDVSYDFNRAIFPGEQAFVRGTLVRIDVPFEGDPSLWRYAPSSFSVSGYPDIQIHDDHISLEISFPDDSANTDALKQRINSDLASLQRAIGVMAGDIAGHNAMAPAAIKAALADRRRLAQSTTDAVAGLGIPLKRSEAAPAYVVPTRRKPTPRGLPPVETKPFSPEPFLATEEYEYILGVIKSMALVMERSPSSFVAMDEEGIRTHVLLQLNGHYEGDATGETFNAEGKTDILIRVGDRNVFIAECKFWRGPKGFDEAVSQLLGYLSWRDSKCALIVFNRTKDSSAVAEKMHEVMTGRAECKKDVGADSRGDRRYLLVKESDPGREITITTMLFDVPSADAPSLKGGA